MNAYSNVHYYCSDSKNHIDVSQADCGYVLPISLHDITLRAVLALNMTLHLRCCNSQEHGAVHMPFVQ